MRGSGLATPTAVESMTWVTGVPSPSPTWHTAEEASISATVPSALDTITIGSPVAASAVRPDAAHGSGAVHTLLVAQTSMRTSMPARRHDPSGRARRRRCGSRPRSRPRRPAPRPSPSRHGSAPRRDRSPSAVEARRRRTVRRSASDPVAPAPRRHRGTRRRIGAGPFGARYRRAGPPTTHANPVGHGAWPHLAALCCCGWPEHAGRIAAVTRTGEFGPVGGSDACRTELRGVASPERFASGFRCHDETSGPRIRGRDEQLSTRTTHGRDGRHALTTHVADRPGDGPTHLGRGLPTPAVIVRRLRRDAWTRRTADAVRVVSGRGGSPAPGTVHGGRRSRSSIR